ncbi:MAG: hypothetical protein ABR577_02165 [Pyrinomonadaceae bacterium]
MHQPELFKKEETADSAIDVEEIVLYALGEFQARGKVLIERPLPLDRLRGALRRAAEVYGVEELDDGRAVAALNALGADVRQVPSFVAKHPFRVVVSEALAERARLVYEQAQAT